ncbi:MAG TPA: N-acetylneuraminate synthase family protein [Polyangiaceae bacterium]
MIKPAVVRIGNQLVGDGQPVYVIAELGINHNGSVEIAQKLIDGAVLAGCNAVKFQKRTPELCVPRDQWDIERSTPWGRLSYIDYRRKIELDESAYAELDRYCRKRKMPWFASCWDEASVDFVQRFEPPCYKIASASITDLSLLQKLRTTQHPLIMSTGMSTFPEIERAVAALGTKDLLIAHSTSTYPCPLDEINLKMIHTLRQHWPECPIGYSGHESGLAPTWAAVAMGASFIERHITLDRAMWGSDQAASVEIVGLARLVSNIRDIERAMGDGVKRLQQGEVGPRDKLRRVRSDRDELAQPKGTA